MFKKSHIFPFFSAFSVFAVFAGSVLDYVKLEDYSLFSILGYTLTVIAGFFGMLGTLSAIKQKISNYIYSMICVTAWFIYVAIWSPLIWDALINVFYLILDIYGLYYWLNPAKKQKPTKQKIALTRTLSFKEYIFYLLMGGGIIFVMSFIGIVYGRYINSTQAIADACSTVFAILAKYFIANKFLDGWYFWILVGVISMPLYISIHNYTLAASWFIYTVNAVYGYIAWKINMKYQQ